MVRARFYHLKLEMAFRDDQTYYKRHPPNLLVGL